MRYYILELKNFKHLEKYESVSTEKKKAVKGNSIIKEYKNELYRYKLIDNHKDATIKNYIDNFTLVTTDFFEKRIEKVFQIPFDSTVIEYIEEKYFIGPSTLFIIEKKNRSILDYYFQSKEEPDSFSLKEDISSFLSHVM